MQGDDRHHNDPPYVAIWLALVVLLVASLGAGALGAKRTAVTLIFVLAAVKAFLVISYYMHLKFEPRWPRVLMLSALVLMVVLFFGLMPDIRYVYGG